MKNIQAIKYLSLAAFILIGIVSFLYFFAVKYQPVQVRITIPEGFDVKDMGELFSEKIENFNKDEFAQLAKGKEGYLFPDTYFFYPRTSATSVIFRLNETFNQKIAPLESEIKKTGKTLKQIIIMASLIEKESADPDDRAVISGILWKRIEKGIRLQVDAWPKTYDISGLPEAPITNPGLDSIKAAIHPVETPYLFYLHDKDGDIHYAKTFEVHKLNKLKYLK